MTAASVTVMRRHFQNGEHRLVSNNRVARLTDDLGRFRLYGLPAGSYIVAAAGDLANASDRSRVGLDSAGIQPTYFPGTTSASEAQRIVLTAGQEATGIVFQLAATPLATVRGVVRSASGRSLAGASVNLTNGTSGRLAQVSADGGFAFASIAPGSYTFLARLDEVAEVASTMVSLNGVDTDLTLLLRRGSTVKARSHSSRRCLQDCGPTRFK